MVSSSELWTYAGTFCMLVAAGLGAPAPEELVISLAGALAGRHPAEEKAIETPVVYPLPAPAEVAALWAVNPHGGFPGSLPWAALAPTAPRELSVEEAASLQAAGLLAVNPHAGFPGGVPWSALGGAGPAVQSRELPPDDILQVRWWVMLPVCIAGVVLSDIILYSLGWWGGERLKKSRWMVRVLSPQRVQRIETNFHRYGVSILVIGRLVPGIRAPLFLTAGSMRLPLPRFLLADGLGAIVGNSIFFYLGYWFGDSIKSLIENAEARLKPILIIVAVGLVVAYLLWHFLRHPVSTGNPKEVPLIGSQVASHLEHAEPDEKHLLSKARFSHSQQPPLPRSPVVPIVSIVFGVLLLALGVWGYWGGDLGLWAPLGLAAPPNLSGTALIPAYVGAALVVLGLLAFKESLLKHAMHGAAAIGLLGLLAALGRILVTGNVKGVGGISLTVMALLCAAFVAACVNTFVQTRRRRRLSEPPT